MQSLERYFIGKYYEIRKLEVVKVKRNPYKYIGPLNIVDDELVLVPRSHDLKHVCEGIKNGEYWAILGPRQIGCTTFLRQIINEIEDIFHLDIDFQVCPDDAANFYQWLLQEFTDSIPMEQAKGISEKWKNVDNATQFSSFLKEFKPKKDIPKILLLFDEIEGIPELSNFLHVWRKIHNSRDAELKKRYTVVIAGSNELVSLTEGRTSPFNIAKKFYIKNFSPEESRQLIEVPFARLKRKIALRAKDKLLAQTNGHPQLLQHSCSLLVDVADGEGRDILEEDIDEVINTLLKTNDSIATLHKDVMDDSRLNILVQEILAGDEKRFHPNKEFSVKGAGCIVENNKKNCTIQNKIHEKFLIDFFENQRLPTRVSGNPDPGAVSGLIEEEPIVFICYSRKDKEWKDKLLKHLKVLEAQHICITWNDENIPPGEPWFEEIKRNLGLAKAAIILITANSLSSDFILHEEIPELLKKKENEGMRIIPVWAEHCDWEDVEWLNGMQMWPNDGKPIEDRSTAEQNRIFTKVTKSISKFFRSKKIN